MTAAAVGPVALLGGQRAGGGGQERLARWADQERQAELREPLEAREHRQALFGALGEAQARIDDQPVARARRNPGARDRSRGEVGQDLADDVAVFGVRIHVLRPAPRVHQDRRHAARGDQRAEVGVVLEAR